jgi:hypothetical protein
MERKKLVNNRPAISITLPSNSSKSKKIAGQICRALQHKVLNCAI